MKSFQYNSDIVSVNKNVIEYTIIEAEIAAVQIPESVISPNLPATNIAVTNEPANNAGKISLPRYLALAERIDIKAVSYTHLTLPTIYSV